MSCEFTVQHSLPTIIRELRREWDMRKKHYPHFVAKGQYRQSEADMLVSILESGIARLEADHAQELAAAHAENPGQRRAG